MKIFYVIFNLFDAGRFNFKSCFNEYQEIWCYFEYTYIISKALLDEYITFRILSCQVDNVSKVDLFLSLLYNFTIRLIYSLQIRDLVFDKERATILYIHIYIYV